MVALLTDPSIDVPATPDPDYPGLWLPAGTLIPDLDHPGLYLGVDTGPEIADWIVTGDDERLIELWPGSIDLTPIAIEIVLDAARQQCETYAPTLPAGTGLPARYILAQALQAKSLVTAGFTAAGDQAGGYDQGVTVYPMDWTVRNLLRPRQGRPTVL